MPVHHRTLPAITHRGNLESGKTVGGFMEKAHREKM